MLKFFKRIFFYFTRYRLDVFYVSKTGNCSQSQTSKGIVFNTHFNLSFTTPKTDTCKICDSLEIQMGAGTTEEDKKTITCKLKSYISEK